MDRRTWMATGLVVLAAWGGLASAQAVRPKAVPAAVVNGVAISMAEVQAILALAEPAPLAPTESQRRQRHVEALGLLIDNVLMRQFLAKHTAPVPPAEVARRLAEMEAGLKKQGKTLAEFCQDTNQTEEQFKASLADHLRWSAYTARQLTDAVVERYFKEHRDFFDKSTVEASHIVLRVPQSATDEEREQAKARLAKLRQQLVSDPKADFAEMARKYSQDAHAAQGGELGVFPRNGDFDESFLKAAFALKPGEISEVVQTDYGYHLIKVTRRNPGTPADYATIKEAVREFCAEDLRQQILVKERKAAKIEINLP
jgi:peptidyl-prolyl cis-trans isomerase C